MQCWWASIWKARSFPAQKREPRTATSWHDPDVPMLKRLQADARGLVKLVTLAPEQPGSMEFIQAAAEEGIHVSIGHTVADYETASAAFAAGADHATHLYNGMPSLHHREPAVIGAAFDNKKVMPEIICDGIHVHGSVIRATFAMFGAERMILISDSLRATGMPDGRISLRRTDDRSPWKPCKRFWAIRRLWQVL